MYEVLIVDDEPTVREGLYNLIDWEAHDFKVTATADNGYEALKKCENKKPDLIISDIRMAGMSGLDLIERLREKNDDVQFLILSGYADFDYAKKAIQNNVAGYLLKPIDEDELIVYLHKIRADLIEKSKKNQFSHAEIEREREHFILSLVQDTEKDDQQIVTTAKNYNMLWDHCQILLIKANSENQKLQDASTLLKKMQQHKLHVDKFYTFIYESFIGIILHSSAYGKHEKRLFYKDLDYCR